MSAILKAAVPVRAVMISSFCRLSAANHARMAAIKRLFPVPPSPNTPISQLWTDLASSKSMICNDTKDTLLCFIQRELMNYIHNRRLVICIIGEEDVRGFVCAITAHTSLLMGLSSSGGIAEPLRLHLKIGERKIKGIDIICNIRMRRL